MDTEEEVTDKASKELDELLCGNCNHPRTDHEHGLGICSHQECEIKRMIDLLEENQSDENRCTMFIRQPINIPMKPRDDLPAEYRIGQGEPITFVCQECGHYETGAYAGLDLARVVGTDFDIENDYNLHCNGCDRNHKIKDLIDMKLLLRGIYPAKIFKNNSHLLRKTRKLIENKLKDKSIEEVQKDARSKA